MVTVITFVARNSDGRGASSTNSSPTSSPYASQARIFLAAAAKGILLKCMSNHATSLPQGALTQGQSESLHRRPRACHGLACPFLSVFVGCRAPPTLAPGRAGGRAAFCGSRTPRHTPALGSWHCRPLCREPIFLRRLSALSVPPPSSLCSNAILPTRPPWPLGFYFLSLFSL